MQTPCRLTKCRTPFSRAYHARCYLGRYSEAEALLREVHQLWMESEGKHGQHTLLALSRLANVISSKQRLHAKAEPIWRELLGKLEEAVGTLHPATIDAQIGLAGCLRFVGKNVGHSLELAAVHISDKRLQSCTFAASLCALNSRVCAHQLNVAC